MFFVFVVSSDSFNRLSHLLSFVNNFFIFFCFAFVIFSITFKRQLVYFITFNNLLSRTFFKFFLCIFHLALSISPGLSSVFYFASAVLATKNILSPRFQIVNVFLVFYLIRTIQTILLSFSFCIHNNFIRSFYNNLLKFIFHISFRYFP